MEIFLANLIIATSYIWGYSFFGADFLVSRFLIAMVRVL
jgi:hypothetical protein